MTFGARHCFYSPGILARPDAEGGVARRHERVAQRKSCGPCGRRQERCPHAHSRPLDTPACAAMPSWQSAHTVPGGGFRTTREGDTGR